MDLVWQHNLHSYICPAFFIMNICILQIFCHIFLILFTLVVYVNLCRKQLLSFFSWFIGYYRFMSSGNDGEFQSLQTRLAHIRFIIITIFCTCVKAMKKYLIWFNCMHFGFLSLWCRVPIQWFVPHDNYELRLSNSQGQKLHHETTTICSRSEPCGTNHCMYHMISLNGARKQDIN